MSDFGWFLVWLGALVLKILIGIVGVPWSIIIAIKQKRLGAYFKEWARGIDILGNKMLEPALNEVMKEENGEEFGGDTTISHDMAKNKVKGTDTKFAKRIEKILNFVDNNHLEKTLKSYDKRIGKCN